MLQVTTPMQLYNNQDWYQPFKLNSYNPNTNTRAPFDLTACQLKMTLASTGAGVKSFDVSTNLGTIIIDTDPTTGQFTVNVPATTMWANLVQGYYNADLLVFTAPGSVLNVQSFDIEIIAGDTAPTP